MTPIFLAVLGAARLWSNADTDAAASVDAAMISAVAACGISVGDLTVKPAPAFGARAVMVATPSARLSDAQLLCIASVYERDGTLIGLTDNAARPRYEPIWSAADVRRARRFARDWLAANNLLDRLPTYDPRTGHLGDYVVRLEQLCGFRAHAILNLVGSHRVEIAKVFWADDGDDRKRECIIQVTRVADLERFGVSVEFAVSKKFAKP